MHSYSYSFIQAAKIMLFYTKFVDALAIIFIESGFYLQPAFSCFIFPVAHQVDKE
jgi:hypothetical protein